MTYQIKFARKNGYTHVLVTGQGNAETIRSFHEEISIHCEKRGISRLLIEDRLESPALSTFELYELAVKASQKVAGKYDAIAYVYETRSANLSFAETVAVNRGAAVATFDSVAAADRWLADSGNYSTENVAVGRAHGDDR